MSEPITVRVRYGNPVHHVGEELWAPGTTFCPSCGRQEVWEEQGRGDYELGPELACLACGVSFSLQLNVPGDNEYAAQRLKQLRAAKQT